MKTTKLNASRTFLLTALLGALCAGPVYAQSTDDLSATGVKLRGDESAEDTSSNQIRDRKSHWRDCAVCGRVESIESAAQRTRDARRRRREPDLRPRSGS